eukprot:TRINITY_DN21728_c0_g1_i3.p1 TRINITY_DN21728_c0_g1~~TRINITY_DN21728_c0_g1_i3.p1  ORF type:complete len:360 (-),score=49.10 TRINITY_DN21728_c0_g1_i3:182-1261(-)
MGNAIGQALSRNSCPHCDGHGWIDQQGKGICKSSIFDKSPCRLCNRSGQVADRNNWDYCIDCKGCGGKGSLGPCGESSMHFQDLCNSCDGKGWTHRGPAELQQAPVNQVGHAGIAAEISAIAPQLQPFVQIGQAVAERMRTYCLHCDGHGWIDQEGKGVTQNSIFDKSPCRLCNRSGQIPDPENWHGCDDCKRRGGKGALGPCGEASMHFRGLCEKCNGKGWIHRPPAQSVPAAVAQAQPLRAAVAQAQPVQLPVAHAQPVQAHAQPVFLSEPFNPMTPSAPPAEPSSSSTAPAEQSSASAASAEQNDCAICLVEKKDAAFCPCGHVCACYACAESVYRRQGVCPMCRTTISSVMKLFQ